MKPSPLEVLKARAEARARLYAASCFDDLADALEPLFDYAVASGLTDQIGPEAAAAIINDAFGFKR